MAKLNINPLTDVITRSKTISGEDVAQVFCERYGNTLNAVTKNIGNLTFVIFLNDTNNELELSPYINIKEPNGKVVLTGNIKDEIVTFLPLLK